MTTIKLNNAARAAIKAALRGHAKTHGYKLDDARVDGSKARLLELATLHGINVDTLQTGLELYAHPDARAAIVADCAAEGLDPAAEATDLHIAPTLADGTPLAAAAATAGAASDVAAILDAWRDMDTEAFKARLDTLAERANRPVETVERIVEVEKIVERVIEVETQACTLPAGFIAAKRIGQTTAGELFGEVIKGRHQGIKLATWDHPHAPKPDPFYAWPEKTGILVAAMFKAHQPVMAWGPKGAGKTSLFKEIAARLGRPFFRISCNSQTEAAVLVGQRVPAENGGTEWKDGLLTLAMRSPGAVLLIDEVSMLREGVGHILQSVLDDKVLHIDETGEVVRAADGVVIALADNTNGSGDATGSYAGTRMMNAATIDRPEVTVRIEHLAAEREAMIVAAKTQCAPALATLLCQYAHVTRQKAETGELTEGISTRRVLSWARTLSMGADVSEAAEAAFLDRARPEEVETLRQLIQTHCDNAAIAAAMGEKTMDTPYGPTPVPAQSQAGFPPITD